jgi:hypothetical protein
VPTPSVYQWIRYRATGNDCQMRTGAAETMEGRERFRSSAYISSKSSRLVVLGTGTKPSLIVMLPEEVVLERVDPRSRDMGWEQTQT